jgi:hypothetical protein
LRDRLTSPIQNDSTGGSMKAKRLELLGICGISAILLACNFTQRLLFNTAGPQAPADIAGTLAVADSSAPTVGFDGPADGLPDGASCDATGYVSVRVGERFVPEGSTSCYQDAVLTNGHPTLPVIVLGHHAGTQGDPGSGRLVQPQSEESDQWSVAYSEGTFSVDWYTAIFATEDCIWLDGIRESNFEQLPSLGLRTVPFSVPSCAQ